MVIYLLQFMAMTKIIQYKMTNTIYRDKNEGVQSKNRV